MRSVKMSPSFTTTLDFRKKMSDLKIYFFFKCLFLRWTQVLNRNFEDISETNISFNGVTEVATTATNLTTKDLGSV